MFWKKQLCPIDVGNNGQSRHVNVWIKGEIISDPSSIRYYILFEQEVKYVPTNLEP